MSVTSRVRLPPRCLIIPASLITVPRATMVLPRPAKMPRPTLPTFRPARIARCAIFLRPLPMPGLITRASLIIVPRATMVIPPEEKCRHLTMCQPTVIAATATRPRALSLRPLIMSASWITVAPAMMARSPQVNQSAMYQQARIVGLPYHRLPLSFTGALLDHSGRSYGNNCDTCHDGSTAIGKSAKTNPAHLATNLDCSACHTTATFIGGTWVHDASTANNCVTCHTSGGGATSKPNGHLSTNEQCDVCHTTNGWAPTDFSHSAQGNYPGDHRRALTCINCHKGSIGAGINSGNYPNQLRYAPFCAGCHAGDFESEGDHNGGNNGTVEQNKNCGASGCHRVNSSGF